MSIEEEARAEVHRQHKRVQLSRRKGWRKPENTIVVARPTKWGNPWAVGSTGWTVLPGGLINREPHPPLTSAEAVESFRNSVEADPERQAYIRAELAGKNLACWCPLVDAHDNPVPCHADILLEIANSGSAGVDLSRP